MLKKYKIDMFLFCILIVIGFVIAEVQGYDANWDFANYHYYGVWALLHGRIGYDIMPCGIQSYFNPLMDFPLYFLIKYFNSQPDVISFIQSLSWGGGVYMCVKIASFIFKKNLFYTFCAVLIGATAVLPVFESGICCGDSNIAFICLVGLYLFIKKYNTQNSKARDIFILLCGCFFGLAGGLKFSAAILFFGFIIACLCIIKKITAPIKSILLLTVGFILGFSITGLWWYILIYNHFENPFFPLMNNIFQSEYALPLSHADTRHMPENFLQYLFYPFYWALQPEYRHVFEYINTDFRPIFIYISAIIFLQKFLSNVKALSSQKSEEFEYGIVFFLFCFLIVTYILWLNCSSILRYIIIFEFLSGIYITSVVIDICKIIKLKKVVLLLIIAFLAFSTKYCCPYETRMIYDEKYIEAPKINFPDNSVVCLLGGFPFNRFIPFYNHKVRYVYLNGEMLNYSFIYPKKQEEMVKDIIKNAGQNIYLIYSNFEPAIINYEYIAKFINMDDFECSPLENVYAIDYYVCKIKGHK